MIGRGMPRPILFFLLVVVGCQADDVEEPPGAPSSAVTAEEEAPPIAPEGATTEPASRAYDDLVRTIDASLRPRPYRARGEDAVKLNATCVSCHADEAKEWRGSHHQRAYDNPAFRDALAIEPTAFCRGCHAAEGDPGEPPSVAVGSLGVACVTCHVVEDGSVLAAGRADEHMMPSGKAPHAVRYSVDFARTGACASCHEFAFPGPRRDDEGGFMQTTIREHAQGPSRDRSCASCHMPETDGRRSHAFSTVRDPEWLRDALDATATIGDAGGVVVTLAQTHPGHAFPTGDLFRRLEVGAEVVGPRGEAKERRVRHLTRHFEIVPGAKGRTLTTDDRVFFEPLEVALDLSCDARPGASIRWWVTYQRVATTGDGKRPEEAKVESEVVLHTGTLCKSRTKATVP